MNDDSIVKQIIEFQKDEITEHIVYTIFVYRLFKSKVQIDAKSLKK